MSRIIWGAPAERFYETGVDRGVLYVADNPGVAWNGLTSVSESPTGGEPKPAYLDGVKFRNIASSEEFEATIEAFSAPPEFASCEGRTSIQNGLTAMQQPRRAFSFAYRTMIGSATTDGPTEYKIHLVYNALSSPAQRSHNTQSSSAEAQTMSWGITTLPPSLTGYKPTAHFVIDSRHTPKGLLAHIEDILYGTSILTPRIPPVSELVTLFQSVGPLTRTNWVGDPRGTNVTYWSSSYGTGGAGTETAITGALDGPVLPDGSVLTTYMRYAWTAPGTGIPYVYGGLSTPVFPAVPVGTSFYAAVYLRSSIAQTVRAHAFVYADGVSSTSSGPIVDVELQPNEWALVGSVRTTVTDAITAIRPAANIVGTVAAGQTFDVTAAIVELNTEVEVPYFDGSMVDANGNIYSWAGAENASASNLNTWN